MQMSQVYAIKNEAKKYFLDTQLECNVYIIYFKYVLCKTFYANMFFLKEQKVNGCKTKKKELIYCPTEKCSTNKCISEASEKKVAQQKIEGELNATLVTAEKSLFNMETDPLDQNWTTE